MRELGPGKQEMHGRESFHGGIAGTLWVDLDSVRRDSWAGNRSCLGWMTMAAKRKKGSAQPARNSGSGWMMRVTLLSVWLLVGVAGGYAWRSYYPVALPFESPLVSDKQSADTEVEEVEQKLTAVIRRAESAEEERDRLQAKLDSIATEQQQTERELADLKIKDVLGE